MKAIGYRPRPWFYYKTAPTAKSLASQCMTYGKLGSGRTSTGALVILPFNKVNASWHLSDHAKATCLRVKEVKGLAIEAQLGINLR